jgi:hypothetical protein
MVTSLVLLSKRKYQKNKNKKSKFCQKTTIARKREKKGGTIEE